MAEPTPVVVPLDNVNDPSVILVAWLVKEGEDVREGQVIAELETSKAIIELTSPASGRISLAMRPGDTLAVGTVIGHIGSDNGFVPPSGISVEADPSRSELVSVSTSTAAAANGVRFSKKALELLERHGLAQSSFSDRTLVREQDVFEYLAAAESAKPGPNRIPWQIQSLSLTGVSLPAALEEVSEANVDPDFLIYLRNNAEAFRKLSSAEKCGEYVRNGASIGDQVTIGDGTVIAASRIALGDGVVIGEHGSIHCRDSFVMGELSSFRDHTTVRGGSVVLGQNVYAGSRIQIGGGGHADPDSFLCVGDNAFLGDDLFINICRPVVIGKEAFLTQRAILVTHNIGNSVLEGYDNRFEPIILEDLCQVGMASVLYAGTRIGHSAIVASNSYVVSSVPAGKLAIGVPARVVRDSARRLDRNAQIRIAKQIVRDFRDLLQLKKVEVSELEGDSFAATFEGKTFHLEFAESYSEVAGNHDKPRVIWVLKGSDEPPPGSTVFNLLDKTVAGATNIFTDSAREFLRKRGMRFQPGPWRYRRGLI